MIARFLLLLIRGYQRTLSPLIGPVCRFSPSCSHYMATCIERFGAARGVGLGLRRLSRCHPFHAGGIDLPPPSAAAALTQQAVVADEAPISLPVQRSSEQSP